MGMQLPGELVEALSWIGCTWPEADEELLINCGDFWGAFAESVGENSATASKAVEKMVAENHSEGMDAFKVYWDKVSGEDGYILDCGVVASSVSIAFYSAGALVLTLKIAVIAQLVAFAIILAAAIAAALETLGASLAAAAEAAETINRTIAAAVKTTIAAIDELGGPLTELAKEHLSKEIEHLQYRDIHTSRDGLASEEAQKKREEEFDKYNAEYQERKAELAKDPAQGGKSTPGTRREAEVALGLERMGAVRGPVRRPRSPGADFADANGKEWDVKGFHSTGRPGYSRSTAEGEIKGEIQAKENVALDLSNLSPKDRDDIKELVGSHPEWKGKVVIY